MNGAGILFGALASLLTVAQAEPPTREGLLARTDDLGEPAGASVGTRYRNSVTAQVGGGDGKGSLVLSRIGRLPSQGKFYRVQLSAEAPFEPEDEDEVELGSLSGLAAGARLGLELSRVSWPLPANQLRGQPASVVSGPPRSRQGHESPTETPLDRIRLSG